MSKPASRIVGDYYTPVSTAPMPRVPFACTDELAPESVREHAPVMTSRGYRCAFCDLLIGRLIKRPTPALDSFDAVSDMLAAELAESWEDKSIPINLDAFSGWMANGRDDLRDGPPDRERFPARWYAWHVGWLARTIARHGL